MLTGQAGSEHALQNGHNTVRCNGWSNAATGRVMIADSHLRRPQDQTKVCFAVTNEVGGRRSMDRRCGAKGRADATLWSGWGSSGMDGQMDGWCGGQNMARRMAKKIGRELT